MNYDVDDLKMELRIAEDEIAEYLFEIDHLHNENNSLREELNEWEGIAIGVLERAEQAESALQCADRDVRHHRAELEALNAAYDDVAGYAKRIEKQLEAAELDRRHWKGIAERADEDLQHWVDISEQEQETYYELAGQLEKVEAERDELQDRAQDLKSALDLEQEVSKAWRDDYYVLKEISADESDRANGWEQRAKTAEQEFRSYKVVHPENENSLNYWMDRAFDAEGDFENLREELRLVSEQRDIIANDFAELKKALRTLSD